MDDINPDAKAGFRRIELLTGPGRRRRWSDSDKAQIVAETLAPGGSVSAVARRWQVSPQQVFGWRREARGGLLALSTGGAEANFVPIVPEITEVPASSMEAPAVAVPPERSSKGSAASSIEIKLAGSVVRVTTGTDTTLLAEVLRAIRASAA